MARVGSTAPGGRSLDEVLQGLLQGLPGYPVLEGARGMAALALRTFRAAITSPFNWWRAFIEELSIAIRRCTLPLVLSAGFFSLGLASVYFAGIVERLGTLERVGGALGSGFIREPSIWVAMMIVAGVVGSAITADLGARKIREELDALAVLGVDQIRALVLPRVLATMVVMPIMGLLSVFVAHTVAYFAVTTLFADSITQAGFADTYWAFIYGMDVVNYLVKLLICGAFVGVVACYNGLTVGGGSEGVGRSVNQCVLITFFGVWFIHTLVNFIFFSLFPDVLVLRG